MQSKAQISGYAVQWIVFTTLMLLIMFSSMYFLLNGLLYPHRNPFPAEASILANNILFSVDGFAAVDTSGRALPGIIDEKKLKTDLDARLQGMRSTGITAAKITIGAKEYYYHQDLYEHNLKARIGFSGRGGAQQYVQNYLLLLRSGTSASLVPVTIEVLGEGTA